MTTASGPESRDPKAPGDPRNPGDRKPSAQRASSRPGGASGPKAAIVFDDPLSQRSSDDSDQGWGERPSEGGEGTADLARFLDEKPPHHL